uniref:RING-type E3 ubiquitin transferase n=1 Tax=Leersia perrieri TaxID=77586 RepID=A0A0D9UW80_9ORYZ
MENPDAGVKKPRLESPNTNVRIKQEAVDESVAAGEAATPPAAAAADQARVEVAVRIDAAVLHCPLCFLPLKPPIFQCSAGHLACGECHAKLAADAQCQACVGGGGAAAAAYAHNPALDAFASSAKIRCPNGEYGCDSYVTYFDIAAHRRACRHAPCRCPEPGCVFLAAPPSLVEHLTGVHSWPAMDITYRNVHLLRVPASERRRLLVVRRDGNGVAGGESQVFLLAVARRGGAGAATAVSVSCVRANAAAAGARFTCKVWTQAAADAETGFKDTIMMEANVRSFSVPGEVAVEEGTVLSVPPWMMHGKSMEMILRVRIDKLRPKN